MSSPFTPEHISSLSNQIDQQLDQLRNTSSTSDRKSDKPDQQLAQLREEQPAISREGDEPDEQEDITERLPVQWQAIQKITKEQPRSFWRRFRQAAQHDLCEEGGVLHTQWQKWGDLRKETVLKSFGAILVAMGFSGNALQVLAVALTVIVLHIGCMAICEEY